MGLLRFCGAGLIWFSETGKRALRDFIAQLLGTKFIEMKTTIIFLSLASFVGSAFCSNVDVSDLYEEKAELERTVWSTEVEAQEHERYFIELWDELRKSGHDLSVFEQFRFGEIELWEVSETKSLEFGITESIAGTEGERVDHTGWLLWIKAYRNKGYRLVESEWHHGSFERDARGIAQSKVSFTLHLTHEDSESRFVMKGTLGVVWKNAKNEGAMIEPALINASDFTLLGRTGPPAFEDYAELEIPAGRAGVVLVNDLNRDGLPDVVLPNLNTTLWNLGPRGFGGKPMHPVGVVAANTGVIGDFTGDGYVDVIIEGNARLEEKGATQGKGLYLFEGDEVGRFRKTAVLVGVDGSFTIDGGPCFSSGDIDGDGDLDLWIGQYKEMYIDGTMPDPYFDAMDGHPSYLLLNEGSGTRFVEVAEERGIVEKRNRRVFSSSLYDYDYDGDLDLLVVSDFSGVDLYQNNGTGFFRDVTNHVFQQRHLFGMAHTIADFNADGLLDLYAIGMSSTTARRLEDMDAGRTEFPEHNEMRMSMGYGNRMYSGTQEGRLVEEPQSSDYARSGWSWGVGSFDLENDGDLETYIANGHYSNESASDYCSRFWTDDIYRGNQQDDPVLETFFAESVLDMMSGGMSWNGFEHNVLFSQMSDGKVRNLSFLMGVASELDSRQVLVEDFDADGKVDLMFTSYPTRFRKDVDATTLRVFRNVMPSSGHWVGVRLASLPGQPLPEGARIQVKAGGKTRVGVIANGDSHQSQHSTTKHFGLGDVDTVESIEVVWPSGEKATLEVPQVNTYHAVLANPLQK